MEDPVLRASSLRKSFGKTGSRLEVLDAVDLDVARGEMVAVAGSSGSGKSTLLHILGGLMHPDAGRVELGGEHLYGLSETRRAEIRNRRVGFVFQFHHLLPEFTALENVAIPSRIAGCDSRESARRARRLLDQLGLGRRADHKPGELSGGEQQRVAVARALVNEPEVVLADEPSGNLDRQAREQLHALLARLCHERRLAFVVATHSPALAQEAGRTLVLVNGALCPANGVEDWA